MPRFRAVRKEPPSQGAAVTEHGCCSHATFTQFTPVPALPPTTVFTELNMAVTLVPLYVCEIPSFWSVVRSWCMCYLSLKIANAFSLTLWGLGYGECQDLLLVRHNVLPQSFFYSSAFLFGPLLILVTIFSIYYPAQDFRSPFQRYPTFDLIG